jgi:hypothetical protein
MLQALNILEGMNVRYMRHNSAPYLHAVTESLKLAFADRNKYVGDPKFVPPIPMREMLSKEYAAARRALIDPDHAILGEALPGDPRQASSSSAPPIAYAAAQGAADLGSVRAGIEDGPTCWPWWTGPQYGVGTSSLSACSAQPRRGGPAMLNTGLFLRPRRG